MYVLDNLFTGRMKNIQHWIGHPNFQFFQHDVVEPFLIEVDQVRDRLPLLTHLRES